MKGLGSSGHQVLDAFLKSAQYLVRLQAQQDIWEHLGKFVLAHFSAEWLAIVEPDSGNSLSLRSCTLPEAVAAQTILTDEVRALAKDVLESGFLATRALPVPAPSMTVFLPIVENYQTSRVMLIGHADAQPLPKELLDIYLALAGLAGAATERKRAEEALKAERQRFHDVVTRLPAYVVLLAPDSRVVFANRLFEQRFGKAVGQRCFEYLFNRTEPCENCEIGKVLQTNTPHHWEWTGPDGRNYDTIDLPFTDTDGSPLVMRVGHDVTERKRAEEEVRRLNAELERRVAERTLQLQIANDELLKEVVERKRAEEALRQSQEWLHVTLTSIGDAVLTTDTKGRVTFLNPVAAGITGWQSEEAQGQPSQKVFQIINEQTREPAEDIVARVLKEEHVFELANHTALLAKDGREVPIEDSAAPILDGNGRVIGVVLVFHDVTEKRRAEEALRHLSAIVESSDDAILGITLEGVITSWNPGAARLYGYSAAETIGQPTSVLIPADNLDEAPAILQRLATGERIEQYETVRRRKNGSLFDVSLKFSPILDASGNVLGASAIARDVSVHKRAEEALLRSEKLASVGRMAASVAHEINNPLAAAMAALYLVSTDDSLASATRSRVDLAQRELDRVAHMARQSLGFYRQTGKPVPVDLAGVADAVLELFAPKLRNKDIQVVRRYLARECVCAMEGEVRQIVSNLVGNSIDAVAKDGRIEVRVTGPMTLDGGRPAVRLTVSDNGTGIRLEHMRKLFEPFFTTKEATGTGLGLWVTRQLVKKHDGHMRVRSVFGRGTVITVFLPVERRSTIPLE
jgi:PAS domain S-box-containing protein